MPTLTTTTQYSFGSFSHSNQRRKRNERNLDWKRRSKALTVHSEGDQPWDFFGRNDAKAETPVLWPPHAELIHAGRDWGQEEKGPTEDEMAGWHH